MNNAIPAQEAVAQFCDAMRARGIVPPDNLQGDGAMRRCDTMGTNGRNNGKGDASYLLHLDGIPAGGFENHQDGLGWQVWRANIGRTLTTDEKAAQDARIAAAQAARKAEEAKRHEEARKIFDAVLQESKPCTSHPYIYRKGIAGAYGARVIRADSAREILGYEPLPVRDKDGNPVRWLVLPVHDANDTLHGLQFIDEKGEKRFLSGTRKQGCYFAIGRPDGKLCIAEGFATAASIREATGCAVAVAFDAGNLQPVAKALREKFPDLRLVLCADDDCRTKGNPGITKATEAARAVGGLLAVPDFGDERPDGATDFNDLHQHAGAQAVKRCIEAAREPDKALPPPSQKNAPAGEYAREVIVTFASDIEPEPTTWLWDGWLACDEVHILAGAPGTGKTTIALNLAATVTTGGRWPDGTHSPIGNVAIWSGEDSTKKTLLPRLMAAGADRKRVCFIDGTKEGTERRPFDPARDMELLRRKLAEIGNVRLLIVDPIVSAVTGDSHKNAEVRRSLQPLADLAHEFGCALLGIHHFAKGTAGRDPAERLIGSQAFAALARMVLVAAKNQNETEDGRGTRIFCRAKSNIGPDDGGFEYDLQQGELPARPGKLPEDPRVIVSAVRWGAALEGTARELLAEAEATDDDGGARTEAERFLENYLREHGATRAEKVREDAEARGFKWRTIQNARGRIKAVSTPAGFQKGNIWSLPIQECKDANSESA